MIACLLHAWLLHRGHGPHTRRTDAAKQRTVVYLSGSGQRGQIFALITLVMPVHRPASANAAASVCLYWKQERALRCQLIVWPRPTAGLWISRSAIASPRRVTSLCFDTLVWRRGWPLHAVLCAHPPMTSTDCPAASDGDGGRGREVTIPRPPVRGPIGHCASPVALSL